jgi:hypothetical protein
MSVIFVIEKMASDPLRYHSCAEPLLMAGDHIQIHPMDDTAEYV